MMNEYNALISSLCIIGALLIAGVAELGGNKRSDLYTVLKAISITLIIIGIWEDKSIHHIVGSIVGFL